MPGPHGFAVRISAVRLARLVHSRDRRPANISRATTLPRPPRPVPTFVTMANAPLLGTGWQESSVDLPDGLSEKFLREVLDRLLSDLPVVLVCRRSVAKFRLRTQRRASQ